MKQSTYMDRMIGVSVTAYAEDQSESITVTGEITTGNHFSIIADDFDINDATGVSVGRRYTIDSSVTVKSLNGENIKKIEASIVFKHTNASLAVDHGTISGTLAEGSTITVNDINATSVTFTQPVRGELVELRDFTIYYSENEYPLWVGNVQVTEKNQDDVLGDGTVSFTPASGNTSATLTLNGVDINGDSDGWTDDGKSKYSTIRTTLEDLTINVKADSTVTGPTNGEKTYSYGILSDENLTITGNGKLTVADSSDKYSTGINAKNIILNGKLSAYGKTTEPSSIGCGVYIQNSITIKEGAELTATGVGNKGEAIHLANDAKLYNEIAGTGWTDEAGTKDKADIAKGEHGREDLKNYKKVQFPAPHIVTFTDGLGKTLDVQYVDEGKAATAPADPTREGYTFNGWDTDFSYVTSNLTVIAQWKQEDATTVIVNSATVSAGALDAAVKKAGGSRDTVTTIVLGKKVKKISKGAFKNYKKTSTLVVQTKKLKKAKVKKSLKGSRITKVKVSVGKKKVNKKYVKKYKKIFTKKNAGKKVKVSL